MTTTAELLGRLGLPLPMSALRRRAWDVIVVGAGHNGLTAAAYLARAGRQVLVLERRDRVGGACTLEEPFAGYRVSPCAYLVGLLHPRVVQELELGRHGYQPIPPGPDDPTFYVPLRDGASFTEWSDHERTIAEVQRLAGPDDADGYRRYEALLGRMRDALRPDGDRDVWLGEPPSREQLAERLEHDPQALAVLFDQSMVDFLRGFFRDERLVDALAGQGVIGTFASPFDPGTASVHFHHSSGRLCGQPGAWGYVRGGMGAVSFALCDAARAAGAVVATGVPVAALRPGVGVELEDGAVLAAPVVLSNADPKATLRLLREGAPPGFRSAVAAVPSQSPVVKVNFALTDLPVFPGAPHATRAEVNITPGADGLHRSYTAARQGRVPAELWCELYFQTAYDPSVAPPGRHAMSAFCQYVPYDLADGDWDRRREEVGDRVEAAIEGAAPRFADLVAGREVLGPPDVERRIGLTGGHIFHGECLPDHMWDRRLPARTQVQGLYLCGAGTHPGGSVIAANGRNAAMAVLADTGTRGVSDHPRIPVVNRHSPGGSGP